MSRREMSQKRATELVAEGWRAIAIIAAGGEDVKGLIRSRLILWMVRPPDPDDIEDLKRRAQLSGSRSGIFDDDPRVDAEDVPSGVKP